MKKCCTVAPEPRSREVIGDGAHRLLPPITKPVQVHQRYEDTILQRQTAGVHLGIHMAHVWGSFKEDAEASENVKKVKDKMGDYHHLQIW